MNIFHKTLSLLSLLLLVQFTSAQNYEFELNVKKKGAPIQSTMYGLFFEDINFGADGGLYAELVKNRSFDFPQSFMGWKTFGNVALKSDHPLFENNPNYITLSDSGHPHKHTGVENEGFTGMGFKKDNTYRFTVWAKNTQGGEDQKIRVELIGSNNEVIAKQDIVISSTQWEKKEVTLKSSITEAKGRLRVFLASKGTVALEHISLFPTDTYKGRAGGLRKDLAQALTDMKPGIFRFPGGCIVEGTDLETRYDWKKSIGPVENRALNENRWHYTFTHRFFPDYYQTYGLGFYEYFLLSEDMGAEPLPVVSCGLACQYQNTGEHCHVPVGELANYVQDALDLIEFANGATNTKWGKVRADMGHPAPFNMKYIGIGNEQWGHEYPERLAPFVKAIRAKYPEIKIIGSSGPLADGKDFDEMWPEMKRLKVDLVDEHYYKDPEWFLKSATRYDNYDRKGPAVFAGEYACHMPDRANSFQSALYEAAFMTGLERNADIVHMCTYAPLFAHVDAWQWRPDMIWFDNLNCVKTPNYYVQSMFAHNVGTNVMPLTWNKEAVTGQEGLYASAVYDEKENCYIVKIANVKPDSRDIKINLIGLRKDSSLTIDDCTAIQASGLGVVNTLESPNNVVPHQTSARIDNNTVSIHLAGNAFGVYKFKI